MALRLRIPSFNTDKIGEGFMLGLGIIGAWIAYRTVTKYAEQFSGGLLPDEFIVSQAYAQPDTNGYVTEY